MTTLIEFLEARIAEDEAAARAATDGPWGVDKDGEVYKSDSVREVPCTRLDGSKYISTDQINVTCDSEGMRASVELENAIHIARHDPARVLREVAAKRAVLETVLPCPTCLEGSRCVPHDASAGAPTWRPATDRDERALKLLATVYSDHPDYREEWQSETTANQRGA